MLQLSLFYFFYKLHEQAVMITFVPMTVQSKKKYKTRTTETYHFKFPEMNEK